MNMSSVKDQLLHNFKGSKDYRHAFVEEKVRTGLAVQMKAIREQRELTQPALAQLMDKTQPWVSRLEDPNQPPPTIPSLLQVAEAFDVDLNISFGPFSELLDRLDEMTPESFRVPTFEEELSKLEREPVELTEKEALRLRELALASASVTNIKDYRSEKEREQPASADSAIGKQRTTENQPISDPLKPLGQIRIILESTNGNRQGHRSQSSAAL